MVSPLPLGAARSERDLMEDLRETYEKRGFTFTPAPDATLVPDFLAPFRPDAIARRAGQNVVIELTSRRAADGRGIAEIRRRLEGKPDWKLHVVVYEQFPAPVARPDEDMLRAGRQEVVALTSGGNHRAAFVLAWSLLESVRNHLLEAQPASRGAGPVVQTLASNGYIGIETERRLRDLIDLRQRIVHGDLGAAATPEDVAALLAAFDEALSHRAA